MRRSRPNLFGALWVTQAVLPYLREQGSGHVIQVTSDRWHRGVRHIGMYHASKWALEGISQSLALEVADFGIKVTIVEPGGYATDWGGSSAKHATPLPVYDGVREASARFRAQRQTSTGDPVATRKAILGDLSTRTRRRFASFSVTVLSPPPPPSTKRVWQRGANGSRFLSPRTAITIEHASVLTVQ